MVYSVITTNYSVVGSMADRIASFTDNMVYTSGLEVYQLKADNRDAMLRLIADLREHLPRKYKDGDDLGVCGYEPQ